MNHLK